MPKEATDVGSSRPKDGKIDVNINALAMMRCINNRIHDGTPNWEPKRVFFKLGL